MNGTAYGVNYCRKQDCPPGHEAGPMTRDHFLIHFIRRGSGVFHTRGHSYTLSKSQCFVIFPGIPAWYRARRHNPWSYSWIGFSGPGFTENFREWGLEPDSPVLTLDDTCRAYYYLDEIMQTRRSAPGADWRIIGNLFKIIGELERCAAPKRPPAMDNHVLAALQYIDGNYTRPIGVSDIVKHVALERSYFSRLFKRKTHEAPRDYLHRCRMNKAMELLTATSFSVEIIARSVGYRDPLNFSRTFKGRTGCSPTEFRKKGRKFEEKEGLS